MRFKDDFAEWRKSAGSGSRPSVVRWALTKAAIVLLCGGAGYIVNVLPVHSLSGLWAGRLLALPVGLFLGPWAGAAAGTLAAIPAAATSPHLVAVFAVEAAVLGFFSRRSRSPVIGVLAVAALFTTTVMLWPQWYQLPIDLAASALPLALQRLLNLMMAPVLADFVSALVVAAWPGTAPIPTHPTQLRSRVFHAFALVTVLPVLVVSTTSGQLFADRQRSEASARLNDATISLADRLSSYIDTHLQAVGSLALSAQDVAAPTAELRRLVGRYAALYVDFRSLALVDRRGVITEITPATLVSSGVNVADRPHFRDALDRRRSEVSDIIRSRITGEPILLLAAPIFSDASSNDVLGIAQGTLSLTAVRYFVQSYITDPEGLVTVLDRNNRVIFASDGLGYAADQDLTNSPLVRAADATPLGQVYQLDHAATGRDPQLASRGIVNLTGWTVIVQEPLTSSTLRTPTYYVLTLSVMALAVCGSLVGSQLLARVITSPLEELVTVVRNLSLSGDAVDASLSPGAPTELAELVSDINGMHSRLAESYSILQSTLFEREELNRELTTLTRELESKVEMRTAELADTMAMMEKIIAAMPGALLVADDSGRIRLCNDMAATLSGRTVGQLKGMPLGDVLTGVELSNSTRRSNASAGVTRAERTMVTSSGDAVPVLVSSAVLSADGSETARSIHIAIDIRQRKQLEMELHHAQKMESVGRLAAGVAHEINTPAQFVSDSIHFLKDAMLSFDAVVAAYRNLQAAIADGTDARAASEAATAAEEEADLDYLLEQLPGAIERSIEGLGRVTTIVRSMKEFAHPDQKEMAPADLNHAIQNTLVIARNEFKYVADLETDLGDLPRVVCHVGDVNQAILNVVVNAAHAIADVVAGSDARGCITIQTREDRDCAVIRVTDTGRGIPERIRSRVFDPFFTTKEVGRGTGQGLAIARAIIVDTHKGSFTFESHEGHGTTFIIRLPLNPAENPAGELAA